MAENGQDPRDGDDAVGEPAGDAVGDAVDDAMADEVKRQKARFVQAILGLDRASGVGRGEEHWNEGFDERHG